MYAVKNSGVTFLTKSKFTIYPPSDLNERLRPKLRANKLIIASEWVCSLYIKKNYQ